MCFNVRPAVLLLKRGNNHGCVLVRCACFGSVLRACITVAVLLFVVVYGSKSSPSMRVTVCWLSCVIGFMWCLTDFCSCEFVLSDVGCCFLVCRLVNFLAVFVLCLFVNFGLSDAGLCAWLYSEGIRVRVC